MNTVKIPFFYILLLVVLSQAHGRRNFEIRWDSCNCTSNSKFAEPCECHVDKTVDPPVCYFNLRMHYAITRATFALKVNALRKDITYTLFDSTGNDFCSFLSTKPKSQVNMMKIFRELVLKAGELPGKCPVDKDFNLALKLSPIDPEQFPPYVPETRFYSWFNFTIQNEFVFVMKIFGDVIQKRRWT